MTQALDIIRREHTRIGSVLTCLRALSVEVSRGGWRPHSSLLFTILEYLDSFAATYHHPKEEQHLFKMLRQRRPECAATLDRLVREHTEGRALLAQLRESLDAFWRDPRSVDRFRQAADAYLTFERRHMESEETEILPLAEKALKTRDWDEIGQAFSDNEDPLFGKSRARLYDELYDYVLEHAPVSEEPDDD